VVKIFFILVAIFVLIRFLSIYYRKNLWSYLKGGPYGDSSTYFFLIQFFRNNNCGVSDKRCLLSDKPVLVPSLFMKLTGRYFSDSLLLKYSWLPSFVIYIFAALFFSGLTIVNSLNQTDIIIFSAILFLTQPDNLLTDKHRVHYFVLQPRFLGLVVISIFWTLYVSHGINPTLGIILVALLVFGLNTSIFSRQTILFSVPITSMINTDSLLILFLVVAILFSSLLFPREFVPSLMPQIRYSYQYFLNYYKPKNTNNKWVNIIKKTFSRPLILESYPYFTFFIVLFLILNNIETRLITSDILFRAKGLFISLSIIFLFTGFRRFAFLGECWRYISFSTYFIIPWLLPILISEYQFSDDVNYFIFIIIILINLSFRFMRGSEKLENKTPLIENILKSNESKIKNAVWYGIPYRSSTIAVALGYGVATFEYQYGNHSKDIHDKYFSEYPILKWDKQLLAENGVTHVFLENEYENMAKKISGFSTEYLTLIGSNSDYKIFAINY
jgi:hypothetical protein